jgi:hypothetical protein
MTPWNERATDQDFLAAIEELRGAPHGYCAGCGAWSAILHRAEPWRLCTGCRDNGFAEKEG